MSHIYQTMIGVCLKPVSLVIPTQFDVKKWSKVTPPGLKLPHLTVPLSNSLRSFNDLPVIDFETELLFLPNVVMVPL
jgi:hypothetical protein